MPGNICIRCVGCNRTTYVKKKKDIPKKCIKCGKKIRIVNPLDDEPKIPD